MYRRPRHESLLFSTIVLAVIVGKIISAGTPNATTLLRGKGEREGGAAIAASLDEPAIEAKTSLPSVAAKDGVMVGPAAGCAHAANADAKPVQSAACTAAAHR